MAVLILTIALAPARGFAQHHDTAARAGRESLTFARHVDTPFTLATAQTAMTNASTVIQTCDGTPNANEDVACQVTMQNSGTIGTFGTTGDGGDIIDTDAKMSALIGSGTADVMVVTAIMRCGGSGPSAPGATIIGCGKTGSKGIVSVNTLAGNLLGVEITHEFLHNQGHDHRGCQNFACTTSGKAGTQKCNCCTGAGTGTCTEGPMTAGAILNPFLNLTSNIINQGECASLHTGPSYTAADNGPIVDPPPTMSCPASITAECTSPGGTPKTAVQIAAFLASATASDGCEPTPNLTNNAPAVFPKGTTPVTFTATDVDFLGASSTCNATVQVVDTTPPAMTCPASISVECSQHTGTPATNPAISAFLAGASAADLCGSASAVSNDAPTFFPLGKTSVTFSATDADGNVGHCSADVNVVDTTPPTIPVDTTIECTSVLGSTLPFGTPTDTCDPNPIVSNNAPPILPFGSTPVVWTASDHSGNTTTGTQVVTVVDTTPPALTVSLTPSVLWPPNHKLINVHATIMVSDTCDPTPKVRLQSITSSEPDTGTGPHDVPHDIQNAAFGADDRLFRLRAEHSPGGVRTYTVTYTAEDRHGNTTTVQATVRVPKSGATLISRNSVPADGPSVGVAVTAHGDLVAFSSDAANLVPHDSNEFRDVFVRNRTTQTTERVSVNSANQQANGASYSPAISGAGQFVAFSSAATNLVPGDGNGKVDVFVRDRAGGTTERVSLAGVGTEANGASGAPSISADGRLVAFHSLATNLVSGDTNMVSDIFVRDRLTQSTERICGTVQADGFSITPAISADGTVVAFASAATNLVPGDTNGRVDIFTCDRTTGALERISVSSSGDEADGHSFLPAISQDGRYVAFKSLADNLVPDDHNALVDVFVRDRVAGTTERVSVSRIGGDADEMSFPPSISYDGRFVAFGSFATNLVSGDVNDVSDVFVRDRQDDVTYLVDVNDEGEEANAGTPDIAPALTGDGVLVGFVSLASNLAGPDNGQSDVFVVCNPALPTPP
jgi:Tol biopolymer transport system component